jgi:hypothetical protein
MVTLVASLSDIFIKKLINRKAALAKSKAAFHRCELIVLINV